MFRTTRTVSVFPVGLVGKYGLSSPVVRNGSVHTFYDAYNGGRTFRVDMAGFAVNIHFYRLAYFMKYFNKHKNLSSITVTSVRHLRQELALL